MYKNSKTKKVGLSLIVHSKAKKVGLSLIFTLFIMILGDMVYRSLFKKRYF